MIIPPIKCWGFFISNSFNLIIFMVMMNIKEILKDYFKLTPLEKDSLLADLSEHYFQEGIVMGLSTAEIVSCFQPLIDEAIKNDDFEVAQAFKDIKEAITIVLTERIKQNGM